MPCICCLKSTQLIAAVITATNEILVNGVSGLRFTFLKRVQNWVQVTGVLPIRVALSGIFCPFPIDHPFSPVVARAKSAKPHLCR